MLRNRNRFMEKMGWCLPTILYPLLAVSLILALLTVPLEAYGSEPEGIFVERLGDLDLAEDDVFTIYFKPNLRSISAHCVPLDGGNPFDLSVSTDYTDDVFGKVTAIWIRPGSRGRYNVTVTFDSNATWDYMAGVYTRNLDFYLDFYGKNVKTYGSFVELEAPNTRLSGNWTISVVLNSHGRSSSFFFIELPTPVNSVLLVTAAGLIGYLNIFLVLDTYFKSRKEIVSNRRWLLSGVVIVASAFVIYQLYTFTTFTLPGGV